MLATSTHQNTLTTTRAEPEAFRDTLHHFGTAVAGGALLMALYSFAGGLAKGIEASQLGHHAVQHAKAPFISLAFVMLLALLLQFGGVWALRRELNKIIIKGAQILIETLSHAFSTGFGVLVMHALIHRELLDPIAGNTSPEVALLSMLILAATALCGYFCASMSRRGVNIESRFDKITGAIALSCTCLLIAMGLMM